MKLLIVDDETIVRQWLKFSLIVNKKYNIDVIEASNGKEAVEIIQNEDIDIVITDIKMPEMDGIALTKYINENKSGIKVIILSNYDETPFVKEALKSGAVDYLLKCESKDSDIEKILDDIVNSKMVKNNNSLIVEFLSDILHDYNPDNERLISFLALDCVSFKDSIPVIAVVKIDAPEFISHRCKISTINHIRTLIDKYVNKDFHTAEDLCFSFCENDMIYVAWFFRRSANLRNYCSSFCRQIIASSPEQIIQFGISQVDGSIYMLNDLFVQALSSVDYCFFNNHDNIIFYTDIVKNLNTQNNANVNKLIVIMLQKIREKRYCDIMVTIFQILSLFEQKYACTREFVTNTCLFMVCMLNYELFSNIEYSQEHNHIDSYTHTILNIKKINDYESLRAQTINCINIILEKLIKRQYCYSDIVNTILKEINGAYDESITLESIAKKIHFSTNYLSRLFKKETGVSFSDYLVDMRMKIAKRVLSEKNTKISLLADQLGYKSAGYFGRVFKENVGLSPHQYKETHSLK